MLVLVNFTALIVNEAGKVVAVLDPGLTASKSTGKFFGLAQSLSKVVFPKNFFDDSSVHGFIKLTCLIVHQ